MRRQVFVRKHIKRWQVQHCVRRSRARQLRKGLHDRQQLFRRAVIGDYDDQRPPDCPMQQGNVQCFGGGGESGDTNPPRCGFSAPLPRRGGLQVGDRTRESWTTFHVREELADKWEDHSKFILADRAIGIEQLSYWAVELMNRPC